MIARSYFLRVIVLVNQYGVDHNTSLCCERPIILFLFCTRGIIDQAKFLAVDY